MALLRRGGVPFHRLGKVLCNAGAELQTPPQLRLGRRIPQPGGGLIPLGSLLVALVHAVTPAIHLPQQELGPGKALLRALAEALQRLSRVPVHTGAAEIAVAQIRQGGQIVPGGGLGVQQHRLGGVRRHAGAALQAPGQIGHAQQVIQSGGALVAGQGLGALVLVHGPVAQLHPVGTGQLLLRQGEEKGAPAPGTHIRLLLRHIAAVGIFTAKIIHRRHSSFPSASSAPVPPRGSPGKS